MACVIKFCRTNYSNGTAAIKEKMQNDIHVEIQEDSCLGNCGQCYIESFVQVNGQFIAITSYEELVDKLSVEV
jgi:uncharacterized protein YuzB (UPF0349 family)